MNTNTEAGRGQDNFGVSANFGDRCVASCKKLLAQIENVKADVVAEFRDMLDEHQHVLELALNEADALAWQTGFPQLFFPTLATEKARAVAGWHLRQQLLRHHTSPRMAAA